jgi:hypothetical protein
MAYAPGMSLPAPPLPRLLATALLLALAACSVLALPVAVERAGGERGPNAEFIETQLTRALAGYGTAKLVNAVVSLAQSVQIGFSLGVSVQVAPAEVLDPVNDMAENVADAFMLALGALALERVLIEINYWLALGVLAPVGLGLLALGLWAGPLPRSIGLRLVALAVVVGAALPVSIQASRAVEASILGPWTATAGAALDAEEARMRSYKEELQGLDGEESGLESGGNPGEAATNTQAEAAPYAAQPDNNAELRALAPEGAGPEWYERLGRRISGFWSRAGQALSPSALRERLERILAGVEHTADDMLSHFLSLLVAILINTLFMPIATLWALRTLARGALALSLQRPVPALPSGLGSLLGRGE